MVDGPGRGRTSLAWFGAGAVAGGLISGTLVALVALLVPSPGPPLAAGLVGVTAAAVLLHDTGLLRLRLPQNPRQVRQSVLGMQPAPGALMFGFELGTGARTFMTGAAPYVAVAAVLMAAGPGVLPGMLAGAGFGLGRGLVPIGRRLGDAARWDAWVRRYGNRAFPVASALATAVAAGAALLIAPG